MSAGKECTPEEIEEKRKLALERRIKRKAAEQKNEFTLSKKPHLDNNGLRLSFHTDTENNVPKLTSEQEAQKERNRLEGIARAVANNLIPPELAKDLAAKRISPGKVPHKFLKIRNAGDPAPSKLQFPIKAALETASASTSSGTSSDKAATVTKAPIATKPNVPVLCQLRFITKDRFEALIDAYNDVVVTEFKKIRSKSYSKLLEDDTTWFINSLYF